jgi:hypothetical protein
MDEEIQQYSMNTSPELTMYIQDVICAQMPYRGGIISHDAWTNDEFGDDASTKWPRRLPRVTQLVRRGFGAFLGKFSKYGICMRKISCLHALYQHQLLLGIPTTTIDLVGI